MQEFDNFFDHKIAFIDLQYTLTNLQKVICITNLVLKSNKINKAQI